MATEKVSLTLDSRALREARRRVGRRGLSGFVDEALRWKLQNDRLKRLIAEWDEASGPVPEDIMEEARRGWRLGSASSKGRSRSRR